jgi:hypothetical protein
MSRTVKSTERLLTPGGGFANETSASILFIFGKKLSVNPCKPNLILDSFELCSGNAIEEYCNLMAGFGVENCKIK